MQELGLSVPKIHDLNRLLADLLPNYPILRAMKRGLRFLTDYAVEPRYPGNSATKREAVAAQRWAERVRSAARALLNIPPPRRRK